MLFEELEVLWEAMQKDPLRPWFWSDFAPQRLEQWAELLQDAFVLAWVIHDDEGHLMGIAQVGGRRMAENRQPLYGELDLYLLPQWRRSSLTVLRTVTALLQSQGYQNLLAYIRRAHRQCRHLVSHAGWTRVGVVPLYIPMGGRLYDAVLYSLKPPQEVR